LGKWKSGIGQPVPEDWRQLVADVLNSGQRKDVEIKDGNKIVSFMLIPIKDKDYVNVYGRDITAYKQLEKTLQESEEKYRQLVENAQEGIWAIDSEARTSFVNKRMAEMLGYTVDEILGKSLFSFMNERGIRLAKELFERHKRGILGQHDFEFFRKDGTRMYASSETSPLTDENGNFIGALACVADITERKRMEVEIQNYSKHLEELVETRTKTLNEIHERLLVAERLVAIGEMAGMVGHDLRNPLQVMVNTIYRAEKNVKSLSVKDRKIVERIGLLEFRKTLTEQVEYMNSIISNLQEYAKVLKPKLVETDLYHLIDNVLSTVTVPENIAVSILIEDDFPLLMLDSLMMRRVFTNLVSNAVQAMPEGGKLTIKASKTEEDVLISFEDTGVGIPQENLSKLFKLLFTTKAKGQGFGLAVCKRLVEAHEGSITVESMVGKGSVFTIRMPIRMEVSKNG
jgi:PAS domain S-box-containing protein